MTKDRHEGRQTAAALLEQFGPRLEDCRRRAGFKTKKDLALLVGVDQDTVGNWCGSKNYPKHHELLRLCDVLGVTADYLLFGRTQGLSMEAYRRYVVPE